jgi:hypothetical protein
MPMVCSASQAKERASWIDRSTPNTIANHTPCCLLPTLRHISSNAIGLSSESFRFGTNSQRAELIGRQFSPSVRQVAIVIRLPKELPLCCHRFDSSQWKFE